MKKIILYDDIYETKKIKILKNVEVISWNRSDKNNYNSILTFIENNEKFFKQKYIDFIESLKNNHFLNNVLKNYYKINSNFSLWEMSLFEEKSIYKTPEINELIKIIALKEMVIKKKIKKIVIYSDNKKLFLNISSLIKGIKIESNYYRTKLYNKSSFLRNNFFYFIYFQIKFFLKRFKIKNYTYDLKKNALLIFDYFAYFDQKEALKGNFKSSFWKNLLPLIKKRRININFIHITLDEKIYSTNKKITILKKINNNKNISHNILDSQISFNIFFKILFIFLKNYITYIILKIRYRNHHIFKNMILHKMFIDSFVGTWSIKNLYFFFMLDKFINTYCNESKIIIYINEFQGWEKSMIYCLKHSNNLNPKIYGLQFNPVRDWDLRYKSQITKNNKNLFPDNIIGFYNSTKNQFDKSSLLLKKINILITKNLRPLNLNFMSNKILLVGDHDNKSTLNLLNMINRFKSKNTSINFEYKPHPISKISTSNFKNLSDVKVHLNDDCFKKKYSAYIVSNKTTLGLELLNKSLKTGVLLDKESLNLSPINKDYKFFISNQSELKNFINYKKQYKIKKRTLKKITWLKITSLWKKEL